MDGKDMGPLKRATASDVAKEAGVSKWTVTRAFTPGASIAPESRDRVMEAAERLGYRPSLLARSLATNRTYQVAVLVDDFANPSKLPFLAALSDALQNAGMIMMLININRHYDHVNALMNVDQRQVDAAVLLGTDFRDLALEQTHPHSPRMPLYVLARDSMIESIPSVSCDSAIAMQEICDHLWARGYKRPGFMTGPKTLSTALGRRRNFLKLWEEHGLRDMPIIGAGVYDRNAAVGALREYLQTTPKTERIDVLMCENDALAMGAIDLARSEFGLDVPKDLAIIGFDDCEPVSAPCYDLTSYHQPISEMVGILVRMIRGEIDQKSVAVRGKLVTRSSS